MVTIKELQDFLESKGNKLDILDKDKAYVLTMNLKLEEASVDEAADFAHYLHEKLKKLGINDLLIICNMFEHSQLEFKEKEPE